MMDQEQLVVLAVVILFLYLAATGRLRRVVQVIVTNSGGTGPTITVPLPKKNVGGPLPPGKGTAT